MNRTALIATALAGLGMIPSAPMAGRFIEPPFAYPCRSRHRGAGKHRPAGSKLARRAASGTVGFSRIK